MRNPCNIHRALREGKGVSEGKGFPFKGGLKIYSHDLSGLGDLFFQPTHPLYRSVTAKRGNLRNDGAP